MSVIVEIYVKKLFGHLDYNIPLNTTDNITILHGPNGCGKTWILQLIKSVFSSDYATLGSAPFHEIGFRFRDGGNLIVRRDFEERLPLSKSHYQRYFERTPRQRLYITYYSKRTKKPKEFSFLIDRAYRRLYPLSIIEREIPNLVRIGSNRWRDISRGEILNNDEVLSLYGHRLPVISRPGPIPNWLRSVNERTSIDFIQSQRLIRMPLPRERTESTAQSDVTQMVELDSAELVERIGRTLAESVKIAQSRDQTFPTRLLQSEFSQLIPETQLREELIKIEAKRQKLYSVGLLDKEEAVPLPAKKLSDTEQKVLSLYLQDVTNKLRVFDDLQSRIATLMSLINTKVEPQGKKLIIDRNKGFLFKTTYGDEIILTPANLSSGEQHQLVLFYELLFKATRKTLFLIDEPEISLNVGWQRRFLSDLSEVIQFGKHYVILATHSPQIIHNRWDLAIPLGGGVDK